MFENVVNASSNRILSVLQVEALEQYCLATQKYCPPSERGPPGPHGMCARVYIRLNWMTLDAN